MTPSFPFSVPGNTYRWLPLYLGLTSCFILIFLHPFSIVNADSNLPFYLLLSGYGILSATAAWLLIRLLRGLFRGPALARVWQEAILVAAVVVTSCLVTYWYANFLHWQFDGWLGFQFQEKTLAEMSRNTLAVLAVPLLSFVAGRHLLSMRSGQEKGAGIKENDNMVVLESDRANDRFRVPAIRISHIRNEDNYVAIHYLSGEGRLTRRFLRSSLSRMESALAGQPFMRCHQSYIVNLDRILESRRENGRLFLVMMDGPDPIPVSRRRETDFDERYREFLS